MGLLDRAKKLADQAKDALSEVKAMTGSPPPGGASSPGAPPPPRNAGSGLGTPYVPGMLGRPGWRERGLVDPAAVLPISERDRAGVPRCTKSEIVEEPFGMGRRWSSSGRSAGLFYQLYPEQEAWQPPQGTAPFDAVSGATTATVAEGRSLVFLDRGGKRVVLEYAGLDDSVGAELARSVVEHLA